MKHFTQKELRKNIYNTISYFAFFDFAPSFEHIYRFFPKKISKKELGGIIFHMCRNLSIIRSPDSPIPLYKLHPLQKKKSEKQSLDYSDNINCDKFFNKKWTFSMPLYTLPQYIINRKKVKKTTRNIFQKTLLKRNITQQKLKEVASYINLLSHIPLIRMVGVTGSASMANCTKNDDIDLMIITNQKNLWLGRFFAILLSHIYGVRQKICLNLFFSLSNLQIPESKKTYYIAHELLQMKPIIDTNNTYANLLSANQWIYTFFPNSKKQMKNETILTEKDNSTPMSFIIRLIETLLCCIQKKIIRKNKTGYLITPTQLWLFKKDYEEKLPQSLL